MSVVRTLVNWLENISNRPNIVAAADGVAIDIVGASALPMLSVTQTGSGSAVSVAGTVGINGTSPLPMLQVVQSGTGPALSATGDSNLIGDVTVTGALHAVGAITPAGGITGPVTVNGNVTLATGNLHTVTGSVIADEGAFVTGGLTVSGDSGFTASSSPVLTLTQSTGAGIALQTVGAIAISPPSTGASLTTTAVTAGINQVWSLTQTGAGIGLGVSTDVGTGIFVTAVSGTAISAFSSLLSGTGVAISGETKLGYGVQGIATNAAGVGVYAQGTGAGLALQVQGNASVSGALALTPVAFVGLPSAPTAGMLAVCLDSTVNTWGAVVSVGGGGDQVLVWYNGTAWTVFGK